MFCLGILCLLWATLAFLFSLIHHNPWFWPLWILMGFIATLILFMVFLYGVLVPIFIKLKPNAKIKGKIATSIIKMVNLICGVKFVVEGKENLTTSDRVLFVSNHKSNLDPCLIYEAVGGKTITAAGKSSLWNIKPLLPLIKAFSVIKINQ